MANMLILDLLPSVQMREVTMAISCPRALISFIVAMVFSLGTLPPETQ